MFFSNHSRVFIVATILLGFVFLFLFIAAINGTDKLREETEGYYRIHSTTILESLSKNREDIFSPLPDNFEAIELISLAAVQWRQDDYLRIASAFHGYLWGESFDGWDLVSMSFTVSCDDVKYGPQYTSFEYYKYEYSFPRLIEYKETISIDPATDSIWFKGDRLYSGEKYSIAIELSELRISSNDALRIAEDNGGKAVRESNKNDCGIAGILAPNGVTRDWNLWYTGKNSTDLLHIHIDTATGRPEIAHP